MTLAIAYYRCSDPRQDRSVGDQGKEARERAQRDGYRLVREFAEPGRSAKGGKIKRRVEFLKMLAYIESGEAKRDGVKAVFFWKLNRIARSVVHISKFVRAVTEQGIRLISLTEDLDQQSKSGRLLLNITAAIDEFFIDSLGEDVGRGMRGAAEEGRWTCGRPPFGYRVEHDIAGHAGRLTVVPAEAEIIRIVFALYEGGDGDKEVARILTEDRGVTPPGSAAAWVAKAVADILTNPVYAGRIVYGGETRCEHAHEAIIAPERWDRVQALRRSRYRERVRGNPTTTGGRGAFLPWLRCGQCGGGMHVQHGIEDRFHYGCRTRTRRKAACVGINVRVDLFDSLVSARIIEDVLTDGALQAAADRWRASLEGDGRHELTTQRTAIEARIAEADRAIRRTVALVSGGTLEARDVADELKLRRAARRAAEDELALLPVPLPLSAATGTDIAAFRSRLISALADKPVPAQRVAMATLISSITLTPGVAVLKYRPRFGNVQNPEVAPHGGPNGSW
ncbi:MAG: recombinase family protein [Pseudomonadota bacterium]|nr:recombinase family protein [Pseudomonadota bacterium]